MKTDEKRKTPLSKKYYIATVLTRDGNTKLAHGEAESMLEFEQWLRTQHDFNSVVWQQSLSMGSYEQAEDKLFEVIKYASPEEVRRKAEYRQGAEEASLFAEQILDRLRKAPDILYIAAGPILVCPESILHLRVGTFSHYPNKNPDTKTTAFISCLLGHVVKAFPTKKVLEVTGGGLRQGQSKGFGYTCKPHLSGFTDVRYFHTGPTDEATHLIQSHVFLMWQMLNESSPFAVDLGAPFYPSLYKF